MDHAITRAAGATPRAVGEFQGYVDGADGIKPSVRWLDRKNMPQVGDKLYALPRQAAAPRSWAILLTSANHGTVGPVGSTFSHAGEHHERVQVMEIVEAGAPPAPDVDVAGLMHIGIDWSSEFIAEVRSNALEEAAGLVDKAAEGSLRSATAAAIRSLKGTCPIAAQAGQVAVPEDVLRVVRRLLHGSQPQDVPGALMVIDSALKGNASWTYDIAPPPGFLEYVQANYNGDVNFHDTAWHAQRLWNAAMRNAKPPLAAAPAAPAQAKPLPADWISVEERLPGSGYCLATYRNRHGKLRIIRAKYARQFEIDAGEDAIDQGNCEYNEADDTFYLKAGWLECIDNWDDYSSIYVTEGAVTHWTPLPPLPDAQASTAGGRQEGGDHA